MRLARRFGGEVVSADSRQVYRGLDIGTGKVPRDRITTTNGLYDEGKSFYRYKGVRHHLIDVASPRRTFTAARYRTLARRAIADIIRRGKLPILCGGTGFYIDAVLHNKLIPHVPPQPELRRELEKLPTAELFAKLQALDPVRAAAVDDHNRRRLIRALEIIETTGAPVPTLPKRNIWKFNFQILKMGVRLNRAELQWRIEQRFH